MSVACDDTTAATLRASAIQPGRRLFRTRSDPGLRRGQKQREEADLLPLRVSEPGPRQFGGEPGWTMLAAPPFSGTSCGAAYPAGPPPASGLVLLSSPAPFGTSVRRWVLAAAMPVDITSNAAASRTEGFFIRELRFAISVLHSNCPRRRR